MLLFLYFVTPISLYSVTSLFQLEDDLKASRQKLSLTEDELDKAETNVNELTTRAETAEKEAEEANRFVLLLRVGSRKTNSKFYKLYI